MSEAFQPQAGQVGTFVKTPAVQIVEVLGTSGADFAILDAEHAPFDRRDIDLLLLAGRAAGLPLLVRVPDASPATILSCLDLGANGLVVPHVDDEAAAREAVARARYRDGLRGYSGAPRHAGYGTSPMAEVIARSDQVPVILQIEHVDALSRLDAILAVEGVAGVLVGRADLALTMGKTAANDPSVLEAVANIFAHTRELGLISGIVAGSVEERDKMADIGADWFVISNDQAMLREAMMERLGKSG